MTLRIRLSRLPILLLAAFAASRPVSDCRAEDLPAADESAREAHAPDDGIATLAPVVVTAPRLPSTPGEIPAAVTVVDKGDMPGLPAVSLDEALTRVPGVFVQNRYNFAQDTRIAIRGFGARAAFGIRGIQIHVDGMPQTLPDGQSQIDSIDPASIERMEVMRGPASALYGNASGGVINIVTKEGPEEPYAEGRTLHGDFGLWKALVQGGGRIGGDSAFTTFSRLAIDGYREHSQAESLTLNGKFRHELNDATDLTLLLNSVYSPELQDPGGLDLRQAAADPSQAAPLNLTYDTGEEVLDGRVGLVLRHALASDRNLEAAAWHSQRDLDNAIPFRFVELDRKVTGGRLQYDAGIDFLGLSQQVFAGIDVQHEIDDRLNFDNIGGSPGEELLLAQNEEVKNIGLFLQDRLDLADTWSLTVGGRYDLVRFEVDDRLLADGDDTGEKTFDQATGRLGLVFTPRPFLQCYASIAQSFETPTTTELVNRPDGGGGINPEIEPQTAVNYEIGLKSAAGRLAGEAALFAMDIEDELIAFRDMTDRVFYRNAGESRRTGAELGLSLGFGRGLEAHLTYTYLDAEFTAYEKDGVELSGNEVPGLPEHQLYGELFFEDSCGVYVGIDALIVGEFPVDDENTVTNDGSIVVNVRTGWETAVGSWLVAPFFGVQNLLDEDYNNNVRINARGGRYFEPAPGLNLYGGLGLRYRW